MGNPATGAAVLLGFRPERSYGIPDLTKSVVWIEPDLPVAMEQIRALTAALEANASGFGAKGIPGQITGPLDVATPLRSATALELFEHVMGGRGVLAKSTLETGVYQYLATPTRVNGDTSYAGVLCLAPVDRMRTFGAKWQTLTIPIGPGEIPARMAGFFNHATHLSAVTQASGTGTYAKGPDMRGILSRPRVGEKLYIKATRTVAGGGLQYKAERVPSGGTATYPGAAIDAYYDSDGSGDWQNLVNAYQLTGTVSVGVGGTAVTGVGTDFLNEVAVGQYVTIAGETKIITAITSATAMAIAAHTAGASAVVAHMLLRDAGYWAENRDTADVVFPGTTTDHGAIVLNDVWRFDTSWSNPTPTYIAAQRFTSAHWSAYWRRQGATAWRRLSPEGNGQAVIGWGATPSQGWGTRHYTEITREGIFAPTFQFARKYTDRDLLELAEAHEQIEFYAIAEGRRLGTGAYRESIRIDATAAELTTRSAPISGPAAVVETIGMTFKASEDGDPPMTATLITDRDYTVTPA